MTPPRPQARRPPRLIVRMLIASFATVAVVLAAVTTLLVLHTRAIVRASVADHLEAGQRLLEQVERQRQQEITAQTTILTENPTLKAALDTYQGELGGASVGDRAQLLETLQREVDKIAAHLGSDVVAVTDADGRTLVSAGRLRAGWRAGARLLPSPAADAAFETIVEAGGHTFRTSVAPVRLGPDRIGDLCVATSLDEGYLRQLSAMSRAHVAVAIGGRVRAATVDPEVRAALERTGADGLPDSGTIVLDGDTYAIRRLQQIGPAAFYAIDSVGDATGRTMRQALPALAAIAAGALVLGAVASLWLARSQARPIDRLSRELAAMASAGELAEGVLRPAGGSREIETLASTFNDLMASLRHARVQREAAYVGAIQALAAALDARDAYTAGHSERVSHLSVAIGRVMGLSSSDLEVLRLGALLHDIGKIGIADAILCKKGALTPEEYDVIKTHPTLGAQILAPIPFLEPHLPIVELHHERPDGRGYPHGLRRDAIPLLARIVHVADAFDAEVVGALARLPLPILGETPGVRPATPRGAVLPFAARAAGA